MYYSSVSRLRIVLDLLPVNAERHTENCRRLFHQEIRRLLDRVLRKVTPAGLSLRLSTPLVVKLGDIPQSGFEHTLCHRLEREFEKVLRLHFVQTRDQWKWESTTDSRTRLAQVLLSNNEFPDEWIKQQLTDGAEHWESVVAGYALLPAGICLEHRLHPDTLTLLCRQWAPECSALVSGSGGDLRLCALYYFMRHPDHTPPEPPSSSESMPEWYNWMRREWAGTSQARQQLQSLFSLTKTPNLPKAPLCRWLRFLWLSEELTAHVRTALPADHAAEWERQLIGFSAGNASPELVLSANSWLPELASSLRETRLHTVRPINNEKLERGDISNVVFGDGLSPAGHLNVSPVTASNYSEDVWFPGVQGENYPNAMKPMSNTKLERIDIVAGDGLPPACQLSVNSAAVSKYSEDVLFPEESLLQGEYHLHMIGLVTESDKSIERTVNKDVSQPIDRSNAEIAVHGMSGENNDAIARKIYRSLPPDCRKSLHAVEQVAVAANWYQINDAGLVLLWPFMPELFRQLGLLKNKRFINTHAQQQASLCLDWLSRGESEPLKLPTVSRRLCGLSGRDINADIDLEEDLRQKLSVWLTDMPRVLPAKWQELSSGDLRQWFLQRPGWCSLDPEHTTIHIQSAVFDVLLNDWSWPTELVALPWLERPLTIRWSQPL